TSIARVVPGGFEGIGLGGVTVPGVLPPGGQYFSHSWNIVAPGYFSALRIPLRAGRDFTSADRDGAPHVAIVEERAARQFWPGASAVGRSIVRHGYGPHGPTPPESLTVVGVVGDIKSSSLVDGLAASYVYLPLDQQYTRDMTSELTIVARPARGRHAAAEVRGLLASMNSSVPIVRSQTAADSVALGLTPQ